MANNQTMLFEDAEIMFRNFAGIAREFNSPGSRNFCLVVPKDQALQMKEAGWNIKETKVREEGDEPKYYTQIKVNFDTGRPPKCVLISSAGHQVLGVPDSEHPNVADVGILDAIDIKKVDVLINPYENKRPDAQYKYKGYLRSIYVTMDEDTLELKYAGLLNGDGQSPNDEPLPDIGSEDFPEGVWAGEREDV